MMTYFAGIDLHATNSVLAVIDDADRVLYQQRLRNDLPLILTGYRCPPTMFLSQERQPLCFRTMGEPSRESAVRARSWPHAQVSVPVRSTSPTRRESSPIESRARPL